MIAENAAQLSTVSYRAPELFDPKTGMRLDVRLVACSICIIVDLVPVLIFIMHIILLVSVLIIAIPSSELMCGHWGVFCTPGGLVTRPLNLHLIARGN
jgi:hypothetical protein